MKKFTKLIALMAAFVLVAACFAGCGKKETSSTPGVEQKIVYNMATEPDSVDPGRSTSVGAGTVAIACFEGLTRTTTQNTPGPGVAKEWDISDDGLVYTFKLRKDAKWSDGDKITANDFDYSWRRVLDPNLASEYVNQLFYIKNAQDYFEGKAKPEDIGIKVVDEYTLEVTLEAPCPYFLELCAFHTLMPVKKDVVDKNPDAWFMDPATYIGNGPFKMIKWTHNDSMEFVKNENYWNSKIVKLEKMKWVMINDEQSSLAAWEGGAIDFLDTVPGAEAPRLLQEGKLTITPKLGTYYLKFNTTKAPFNDARVRQAFTLALNRQEVIDAALRTGEKIATGYVPYGIADTDETKDFRTVGGDYVTNQDIEKAKQLLAEAGYPDGKGFPDVTYLFNTHDSHKKIAEALQDMWKRNLGVDIKIANQEWKVFLDTVDNLKFDFARSAWIGDYIDPMTFLDMYVTNDGNNDTGWSNAEYDDLIKKAKLEPDQEKRIQYMHDAETILMRDMPIGPIYFYVNKSLIKPNVKGIFRSPLGAIYFDEVYVE